MNYSLLHYGQIVIKAENKSVVRMREDLFKQLLELTGLTEDDFVFLHNLKPSEYYIEVFRTL